MAFTDLLISDCTIQRRSGAKDAYGNPDETWTDLVVVRARYSAQKQRPVEHKAEKKTAIDRGTVYMLPTDVTEKDRLVMGGQIMNILNVMNPALLNHHFELTVELVKP